jgi:hypothetical protein
MYLERTKAWSRAGLELNLHLVRLSPKSVTRAGERPTPPISVAYQVELNQAEVPDRDHILIRVVAALRSFSTSAASPNLTFVALGRYCAAIP